MKSRFASFSAELPSPLSPFGLAYNTDNGGRDLLEPYEHASALLFIKVDFPSSGFLLSLQEDKVSPAFYPRN